MEISRRNVTIGIITIVVIWVAFPIYPSLVSKDGESGTFGDQYGALNTLFTGFAFGALVLTLIMQRRELGYQRKELEFTRRELKGQKEEMQAANALSRDAGIERGFFAGMSTFAEIRNSIGHREFINAAWDSVSNATGMARHGGRANDGRIIKTKSEARGKIFGSRQLLINERMICALLYVILDASEGQKRRLSRILFALLDDTELQYLEFAMKLKPDTLEILERFHFHEVLTENGVTSVSNNFVRFYTDLPN